MTQTQAAWLVMHRLSDAQSAMTETPEDRRGQSRRITRLTRQWDSFPAETRQAAENQFSARTVSEVAS